MDLTERTYCQRAAGPDFAGWSDAVMWRSASYCDGSPIVAAYRTSRPSVMLLDTGTALPWLVCHDRRDESRTGIAPVPYVGALATILSDLVEVSR